MNKQWYEESHYLGVTQQVSSACAFQVLHLKTETRKACRVTPTDCL